MHNNRQGEFEQTVRQYADNIYRIALLHTQSDMDAQDIVQEVFMKYAVNKKPFNSDEHKKAWLIKVTINMCIDLKRSAWSKKTTELTDENSPSVQFESSESDVYQAVIKLPEKYRTVVHLFYYEDYSVKTISNITGQSESTVKTQLSRARVLLKNILKEEYEYAI